MLSLLYQLNLIFLARCPHLVTLRYRVIYFHWHIKFIDRVLLRNAVKAAAVIVIPMPVCLGLTSGLGENG